MVPPSKPDLKSHGYTIYHPNPLAITSSPDVVAGHQASLPGPSQPALHPAGLSQPVTPELEGHPPYPSEPPATGYSVHQSTEASHPYQGEQKILTDILSY